MDRGARVLDTCIFFMHGHPRSTAARGLELEGSWAVLGEREGTDGRPWSWTPQTGESAAERLPSRRWRCRLSGAPLPLGLRVP